MTEQKTTFSTYLRDFKECLEHRGLLATINLLKETAIDRFFDIKAGVDTFSSFNPGDLAPKNPNATKARLSDPSRARPLAKLLKELNLPFGNVFVDFGSGKGRALIIAALYGFNKVKGIEFNSDFVSISKKNFEFLKTKLGSVKLELMNMDVTEYKVSSEDTVFYFYDPFEKDIMNLVISNIEKNIKEFPRDATMIYHNNLVENPCFENDLTCFELFKKIDHYSNRYFVYKVSSFLVSSGTGKDND